MESGSGRPGCLDGAGLLRTTQYPGMAKMESSLYLAGMDWGRRHPVN